MVLVTFTAGLNKKELSCTVILELEEYNLLVQERHFDKWFISSTGLENIEIISHEYINNN